MSLSAGSEPPRSFRPRGGRVEQPARTVSNAIDAYLRDQGFEHVIGLAEIAACWSDVVGADVADHALPKAVRDGELLVEVDHPAWATEVAFLSAGILSALAERLGHPVADRLKVHVRAAFRLD